MAPIRKLLLFSLLSLISSTLALPSVANLNPTGAGCVDPAGYLSCYDAQLTQLNECLVAANITCSSTTGQLDTCILGCSGHYLASKIGCWLQGCWNRVYSCEYQQTVAEFIIQMDFVQSSVHMPFYPAPDGVLPGGCTCNLGNAVGNFTDNAPYHCMNVAQESFAECTCCDAVIPISNALNACPNTDLSIIGFDTRLQSVQRTMAARTPDQCAILDGEGMQSIEYCAAQFGVTELAGPKLYNALKLPEGKPGTEPLSNYPGEAFTSFFSLFTLAADPGYKSTITPAPYNKKNAEKTSAAGGGSANTVSGSTTKPADAAKTGASQSVSGGASATGSAASSTPPSSGVRIEIYGNMLWILGAVVLVVGY